MLTIIDNPNAPTEYDYKVTVPSGGHIGLTEDGGAVVLDNTGEVLASVAAPWAKDANDSPIRTFFTTNGSVLIQHIEHNVSNVVYPVTADPKISWSWHGVTITLTRDETYYLAIGATAALGYRIGGASAAGISAAGGAWLGDQARKRGMCVAAYKSHAVWWFSLYITRCP